MTSLLDIVGFLLGGNSGDSKKNIVDNRGTTNKNYFPSQTSLLPGTKTPAANN
jgi:hypothetical protein